ncbi:MULTISPECIES: YihY/virulence factor BrkB family protein [Methylobacterium]|uniref:YihY/virulence factor BrkB family protein n=2 Tax=Methylobacterium TaxID=407 RepID=A0A2R4WM34_9HYPH|nr:MULTISPECIES: YihY/virulence factor BrkB family protein [Methylobacterium]MBZ6411047.1 YihY/virulence factor BrkB family protein [Methylobacterium sp.]AWB22599.1 YihY/virulence factor BrkB family protein [Methylobacterium currus]MBK3397162.1 YihY/virulence factor BrkB family protein [Methylobacterium ajmalii]MBK3408376.1 YihY/virulence factor BrkB family protein [Methylobacterium ajmalii]MBK3422600.1 YihY/virulence factor BrkB family protein [Methylobacterium ajmalii]
MTDQPAPTPPSARPERTSPTLWTACLGVALVGLVALPKRRGGSLPIASGGPGKEDRKLGTEDAPVSHEGAAAERLAEAEPERGRKADTPSEIPAKGWKDIALRLYREFGNDRILLVAAGVTFYAILALFPAIAALVSIYGAVADPSTINHHLNDLRGILPDGAIDIVGGQVKRLVDKGDKALGLTAIVSILISLWSANGGMKAVFDALNIAYEEEEKRSFVMLNLQSLAFTVGALLFVGLALTGIVVVPAALQVLGLDQKAWYIALLRFPVLLVLVIGSLAVLYRFGPSRRKPRWRWVTWGSAVAGSLWLAASGLFSWYVANFGSYNETYGSLGAAIGFMTWIWLSTTVVLLGAELNAEMEHQTARDTTVGGDKPLGARQARMADTVAASS